MTPNTGDGIGIAVWRREKRKRGRKGERARDQVEISRIIEKKTKKRNKQASHSNARIL